MAKVDDHWFAQLLKSFNLIYICLGRFLYAVGPSELRFFVRPACSWVANSGMEAGMDTIGLRLPLYISVLSK